MVRLCKVCKKKKTATVVCDWCFDKIEEKKVRAAALNKVNDYILNKKG